MNTSSNPPRNFGALLTVFGIALAIGGINLLRVGDNAYFLVVGLGVAASGVLIALGRLAGARLYLATFAVVVIWSLADHRGNFSQALAQIFLPGLLCAYIFSGRIRSRLS